MHHNRYPRRCSNCCHLDFTSSIPYPTTTLHVKIKAEHTQYNQLSISNRLVLYTKRYVLNAISCHQHCIPLPQILHCYLCMSPSIHLITILTSSYSNRG